MRNCPFHQCEATLPDNLFACKPHWRALDMKDRWKISDAYASYLRDQITLLELRTIQQIVLGNRGTA